MNNSLKDLKKAANRSWRIEFEGMKLLKPESTTSERELPFLTFKNHILRMSLLSESLAKDDFRQVIIKQKVLQNKIYFVLRFQKFYLETKNHLFGVRWIFDYYRELLKDFEVKAALA